jgi:hypothetical protein
VCVERSNTYKDKSIKIFASVIIDPCYGLGVFFPFGLAISFAL